MHEARGYAACLKRIEREDYLEHRSRRLLTWADQTGIATLQAYSAINAATSLLLPLATSCFLHASDFEALVAVSRSHCRTLGVADVVMSLLQLVLAGFDEMHCLTNVAEMYWTELDRMVSAATVRLRALTREQVRSVRSDARGLKPGRAEEEDLIVLEAAAALLLPGEPVYDCIAVRRLMGDAAVLERAASLRLEAVTQTQCRHFRRMMAQHREVIAVVKEREGAPGAFAEWVEAIQASLEEQPRIHALYSLKSTVAEHVVPLARWITRPHLRPLLGRMMPPLDSPDPVAQRSGGMVLGQGTQAKVPAVLLQPSLRSTEEKPHEMASRDLETATLVSDTAVGMPLLDVPLLSPEPPRASREASSGFPRSFGRGGRRDSHKPPKSARQVTAERHLQGGCDEAPEVAAAWGPMLAAGQGSAAVVALKADKKRRPSLSSCSTGPSSAETSRADLAACSVCTDASAPLEFSDSDDGSGANRERPAPGRRAAGAAL
eukprot:CAMPEP_0179136288 /NCGR_PEP_ID=MMETSP0796-20121207/64935_1 /TAXON_ID=73915 /ORGANISM="Pyrodinium bahamense, Strain pbaha01" /LENGTH=490 /DNA_ID=CAMNT_0020835359 /DNA_START=72 /DNA_END=1542 /DNA_ORIENTATION=-